MRPLRPVGFGVVDHLQGLDKVEVVHEPRRHREDLEQVAHAVALHIWIIARVVDQDAGEAFLAAESIEAPSLHRAAAVLLLVMANHTIENRLPRYRLIKNGGGSRLALKKTFGFHRHSQFSMPVAAGARMENHGSSVDC